MSRTQWHLMLLLFVALSLLTLFRSSIIIAAPLHHDSSLVGQTGGEAKAAQQEGAGQEYVVKRGDWLSKISQAFYGDSDAWQVIIDATNARAATDPRFTVITDPDALEVGQLLWIPDSPSTTSGSNSTEEPAEEETTASEEISATGQITEQSASAPISPTVAMSPSVRFAEPQDGAEVAPTFVVTMAAQSLTVEPAGQINEGAGHFHIIVDSDFIEPGELVPFDEQHLHFGKGQLTTTLELEPGLHTLRLQFANGAHIALEGDQYRDEITVTVLSNSGAPRTASSTTVTPTTTTTATTTVTEEATLPSVHFVDPEDGAEVSSPFDVSMAAESLTVEPAGEIKEGAGHFHIIVDSDFIEPGELLPFDEQHLHFGKGQLTTTLELEPGLHTLRLQFANGAHIALEGDQYRDEITVTVDENN